MDDFRTISNTYGIKATTTRKQLFSLLKANSPIIAKEFIELAKQKGFDTVTIYRTINIFQKYGVIFEFGSGKQRTLQLHSPDIHDHHHYIRCTKCDKVARFEDSKIEKQLAEISAQKGFKKIESHYLEIIGTCVACDQFSRTA